MIILPRQAQDKHRENSKNKVLSAGESLSQVHNRTYTGPVTEKVGNDWGYSFTWTLRDGDQTIEQHEYLHR